MTNMELEIMSQPAAVRHAAEVNAGVIAGFAEAIKARGVKQIVVAARGSSDNACNYFKYLCEIYAGIPVSSAAPSVITLYDGALDLSQTAVIGVSQSGAAADVIAVVERARSQGGITAAITNNKDSALAKAAEYSVFMDVGEEKSVAATKTFTAQMYMLAKIADALSGGKIRTGKRAQNSGNHLHPCARLRRKRLLSWTLRRSGRQYERYPAGGRGKSVARQYRNARTSVRRRRRRHAHFFGQVGFGRKRARGYSRLRRSDSSVRFRDRGTAARA